jgi:hypothetical protein
MMAKKMGRPSKYTPELAATNCRRIADGECLRTICASKGIPSRYAVRRWLAEDSDFRSQYSQARDDMVDALADKALHYAETATSKNANARRLYVDTVKWYVGKVAPKKYGELDLNVTVGDAIEEGRKRVAKLRNDNLGGVKNGGQRPNFVASTRARLGESLGKPEAAGHGDGCQRCV